MQILISACLLGANCKYSGGNNYVKEIEALKSRCQLVPVCPEIYGGLSTPRIPSERRGKLVVDREGRDVTAAFQKGAEECLRLGALCGCTCAVLKERSPSCGSGVIYDGSFSGTLTEGDGVFAELLKQKGIPVYGESRIGEVLALLEKQ